MKQIDKSTESTARQQRWWLCLLLIGWLILPGTTAWAQSTVRVSGRVLSTDNNAGLPGVNVSVKGTTTGSVTDAEGNYSLTVPDGNATLVFSFIGYVTQEVALNNRTTVNVSLAPDTKSLNEVVVVAYGTQKRADVTGSVTTVSASEIKDIPVTQFAQKLQGKTPGVQILQNTGQPGRGMSIRIRPTPT